MRILVNAVVARGVALLATFFLVFAGGLGARRVIPVPASETPRDGEFIITKKTGVYTNLEGEEKARLAVSFSSCPLFSGRSLEESDGRITGGIAFLKTTDAVCGPAEGYRLEAGADGITVSAATDAGLFYGLQTLLQLASPREDGVWSVGATAIEDSPRFPYRGFMIDVSRHFRTKEFIRKQIDAMARYKLNRLHLHLTDAAGWRIEIRKHPILTEYAAWRPAKAWKDWWNGSGERRYCAKTDSSAYGGYYTQDDIRELVRYAADRHVTIVPEIEMPSHSEEVLAVYPELACPVEGIKTGDFCIGNEKTFGFIEEVLTEVMELFPSEYIHVGGDEASKAAWKKCPECQRRIKEEGLDGEDGLQSYLIHRVEAFLKSHGRRLLGWDEIMDGGLAPEATVMSWRGESGGVEAMNSGHRAIMSPGDYCYFDKYQDAPYTQPEAMGGYLPLSKVYAYEPFPALNEGVDPSLLYGVQANLWAEYITADDHYEYMIYPRLLALSETAWSLTGLKSYTAFHTAALRETGWLRGEGYNAFPLSEEIGNRPEASCPVKHKAFGKPVKYNAPYNDYYRAGGDYALTDGLRGSWANNDGVWQGFISRDRLDVVVDLEGMEDISSVSADFLQSVGPEIFLPAEIVVSASADGKEFTELLRLDNEVSKTPADCIRSFGWKGEAKARYVRFQAQSDKKLQGWIFTDEIVVR